MQADPSHRTSFIVGFAMHRPMCDLFVQTIAPNTLGKIFNRRHFEIFFSFFQENRICISCKLSPLYECQTCFLGYKKNLFVQTIAPNTLGKIFIRQHFEIFFSFLQENRICISCNCLHCMNVKPVFLDIKKSK